ncbi:unnamed protein product [Prunus armeniaca]|uniref:Phytocyanin domain-containing protein n=1 Tax=Prunus armeniaca TaxID=36596 RepID=A0A6J5VSC8_PRUAR|nr:unnamed protein product [Prunus armeniaca]
MSQKGRCIGGNSGWTFNVENWTDGKKFKAGDNLFSTMIHPPTMLQLLMPMNLLVAALLQTLRHSAPAKIESNYRRDSTISSAPSPATAMGE